MSVDNDLGSNITCVPIYRHDITLVKAHGINILIFMFQIQSAKEKDMRGERVRWEAKQNGSEAFSH